MKDAKLEAEPINAPNVASGIIFNPIFLTTDEAP
jgi:hypothetical protein